MSLPGGGAWERGVRAMLLTSGHLKLSPGIRLLLLYFTSLVEEVYLWVVHGGVAGVPGWVAGQYSIQSVQKTTHVYKIMSSSKQNQHNVSLLKTKTLMKTSLVYLGR